MDLTGRAVRTKVFPGAAAVNHLLKLKGQDKKKKVKSDEMKIRSSEWRCRYQRDEDELQTGTLRGGCRG